MKYFALLSICIASVLFAAPVETQIESKGYVESSSSDVEIAKTKHTIFGIDIYGTDSKTISYKGQTVRDWDVFVSKQIDAPIHNKDFDPKVFADTTGYEEDEIVYLNSIYFVENNLYIPATHVQTYRDYINTTIIVEQGTYRILLDRKEVHDLQPIDARHLIQNAEVPEVQFQWWSDDSPAPGSPHLTGMPDQWQAPQVFPSFIGNRSSTESPQGWIFPTLPYQTTGNNVFGLATGVNNELYTDGPVSTETSIFAPEYNLRIESNQSYTLQAATVNMFVHANVMHDWHWNNGFREENGNFQTDNFGRGGVGGDAISVAARFSYTLVNNAFFSGTNMDGTPAAISMLRFVYENNIPEPSLDRHSGFDSQIFAHEYQHGVTIRLVGNMSVRSARSMGEGWSDIVALIYSTEDTADMKNRTFAMGGWSLFQFLTTQFHDNYYYGGRILPLTYDMSRNPLTLADSDANQFHIEDGISWNELGYSSNAPHFVGQIWTAALWDIYTLLNEVYDHETSKTMMMRILIEGLKLTPPDPSFIEARDAFIMADEFLYSGEHRVAIWEAFARRGMGIDAIADENMQNIVEDLSDPNWADYDQNGSIDVMDTNEFILDFDNQNRRADLNWDGVFDAEDIQMFIDLFESS